MEPTRRHRNSATERYNVTLPRRFRDDETADRGRAWTEICIILVERAIGGRTKNKID